MNTQSSESYRVLLSRMWSRINNAERVDSPRRKAASHEQQGALKAKLSPPVNHTARYRILRAAKLRKAVQNA